MTRECLIRYVETTTMAQLEKFTSFSPYMLLYLPQTPPQMLKSSSTYYSTSLSRPEDVMRCRCKYI